MAVLAIMVGVAAIAVNRYLVRSHKELIETSLPAMELASRIGAATEVVGTLAVAFEQADTSEDFDQITTALRAAVSNIEAGARELESISLGSSAKLPPSQAAVIAARMAKNGHEDVRLKVRIAHVELGIADAGAQLASLIEAETDLARLRITAGIVGIYTDIEANPRAALDTLADRHFFAFERITELARMIDAVRLELQRVPNTTSIEEIAHLHAELGGQLALITRRLTYLPTLSAREKAATLLQQHQDALADEGLIGLQRKRLAVQRAITADSDNLRTVISRLSERARHARDTVQAQGLERIAAAQTRSSQMTAALLALVAAAVIAGAILWLYARKQLVTRMGNLSRRIVAVAGGDYDAPMAISGHDEIGRMEKALNILRRRATDADRLRGNLEEAVIARTGDVVAEMKASDTARAEAEAANSSKTEFLARMSHEIRTPLNGIIGMLDLLEADERDPARKERALAALNSSRELLEITNDILNYAGAEDSANRGSPVHFLLRELVGQLGQQLQSLAAQKKLDVAIHLAEPAPMVLLGDVVKIRQIVGNLISNAVKYTKRGSVALSVDHAIDAQSGQPVISFSVTDTGVGMTQNAVTHAFDAYMRTDAAKRAGIEGMGLGLAISRKLTEALGGGLSVASEPGVGSQFTLTLPLAMGDPALARDEPARLPDIQYGQNVLVIDDHPVNLMVARGYLERLGCHVHVAATGTEGLKAGAEQKYDLVLIDLDLPDMRGEEVAAQLRLHQDAPLLVALTAYMIEDTVDNRAKIGVARILHKPVSARALAAVLAKVLGGNTSNAAAESSELDLVLQCLREDMSDLGAETTGLIVGEFLKDLTAAVNAVINTSGVVQQKAAHKLKGAAANFRLESFCTALALVEATADDDALKAMQQLADEAARTLATAASSAGLQTDAGSTK